MAKYIECPKCGALNSTGAVSGFVFGKKFNCVNCNEEINPKQNRMIAKQCSCGQVVVFDQKKSRGNKKCPSCGGLIDFASATSKFKMVNLLCPQCGCSVDVLETDGTAPCPVCDYVMNVAETAAKNELVDNSGISIIKYEGDNETFIWKHPAEDFNWGSKLIVHQSQEAVFYLNGEALDIFGPGEHILETENLPVLKNTAKLPTGKQHPFHAEVYFINLAVHMSVKWGTDSRIRFIEPNTGIPLDIGASGEMNVRVGNSRMVLDKLVGTTSGLSVSEAFEGANIRNIFRPIIQNVVKSNLAAAIKKSDINIIEIDQHLEELSDELQTKIAPKFEEYGFAINEFFITNFVLPDDNANFRKLKDLMSASYLGVKEQEVKAKIAEAERQTIIEQEKNLTEKQKFASERKVIESQADAASLKAKGFAEAEVMAAQGYNKKDIIQADVQKAYAEGIGNFGANGGSLGGGLASDVMGLGIGVAAAGTLGGQLNGALSGMNPNMNSQPDTSASGWKCTECGADGNRGKFCSECGKPKPEEWDCTFCGAKGNHGRFCSECGKPKPEAWDCPACGAKGNHGKFCSECGTKREDK